MKKQNLTAVQRITELDYAEEIAKAVHPIPNLLYFLPHHIHILLAVILAEYLLRVWQGMNGYLGGE